MAIQLLATPEYFNFGWTPLLRERDKITSTVARRTISTKTYSWRNTYMVTDRFVSVDAILFTRVPPNFLAYLPS